MSLSVQPHELPPKQAQQQRRSMSEMSAVALREPSAANAPFQRKSPCFPPTQNVNSAASPMLPACHFSGSIANCAESAVTTATFTIFSTFQS